MALRSAGAEAADAAPDPTLPGLAERAEAAIAAAGEGVGREFANRLRSEHRPAWLSYLKGQAPKPAHPGQAEVIADFVNLIELIDAARTWPAPGEFGIPKARKPPAIDGKLDDEAWAHATVWTETFPFSKAEAADLKTTWKTTWDDNYLYFAFDCQDPDIVAAEHERDGPVWQDDCVEMFIWSDPAFPVYWEIVIAPNGSVYDAVNFKYAERWGGEFDPGRDVQGLRHAQRIRGTINDSSDVDEGYTVEVAVPFNQLPGYSRRGPKPGDRIPFMLVRLDRSRDQFRAYSFRPLQGWGHNLWNYAVMRLEESVPGRYKIMNPATASEMHRPQPDATHDPRPEAP
jgi:hypothetical protein